MLTLIKTGHPEEGCALSSPAPLVGLLRVFVFVEERQSQEAVRRVHQSSRRGASARGLLVCDRERNLYCPIVPLFPRSHHTSVHPVHTQVSGTNQSHILFHVHVLSFATTLDDQQHVCAVHTHTQTARSLIHNWGDIKT